MIGPTPIDLATRLGEMLYVLTTKRGSTPNSHERLAIRNAKRILALGTPEAIEIANAMVLELLLVNLSNDGAEQDG